MGQSNVSKLSDSLILGEVLQKDGGDFIGEEGLSCELDRTAASFQTHPTRPAVLRVDLFQSFHLRRWVEQLVTSCTTVRGGDEQQWHGVEVEGGHFQQISHLFFGAGVLKRQNGVGGFVGRGYRTREPPVDAQRAQQKPREASGH